MLNQFKKFIFQGSVFDLAIGVIIGGAMTSLVSSLTKNLLNPLIATFTGKADLSGIKFTIFGSTYKIGNFLNDLINFFIISFVVFLLIKVFRSIVPKKDNKPEASKEEVLLTQIRDLLSEEINKNK